MTARHAGRLSLPFLVQRAGQHTRITATDKSAAAIRAAAHDRRVRE